MNSAVLVMACLAACEKSYHPDWHGVSIENQFFGIFCRITETEDSVDVTWRGTDNGRDWIVNLSAFPWRYGGAWVHLGFAFAHWVLWPAVRAEIERRGATKPVRVFGHSLGSALAELSCLFLRDYPQPVSLVCLAKPNTFIKPLRKRLGYLAHQISVICGCDLVARIPRIFFGADLGQSLLYLANNGMNFWGSYEDRDFRRVISDDFRLFSTQNISHHLLPTYRERLEKMGL